MKNIERDLLLLLPPDSNDEIALEREITHLRGILDEADSLEKVKAVVEFVNLHRGGITQNQLRIENALRRPALGPFQFILYKN